MKSKDLQKIVLSKYQNSNTPTKVYRDLNGGTGLRTIKRWCQMIRQSRSITLASPSSCFSSIRKKKKIQKVLEPVTPKKKSINWKTIDGA